MQYCTSLLAKLYKVPFKLSIKMDWATVLPTVRILGQYQQKQLESNSFGPKEILNRAGQSSIKE